MFFGNIGVLNPGSWNLADELPLSPPGDGVYLFRTLPCCQNPVPSSDGALCPESRFDTPRVVPATPPAYYDPAASAVVLELTGPPYAFGNAP